MTPPPHADVPGAAQAPALRINAIGKKCPLPIIMLAQRIADVPVGSLIEVWADDPAAKADVPAWCRLKSHELVLLTEITVGAAGWAFLVRRSY
jgi:tRNA 2-thiouridine synthesizing protein A